MSIYNLARVTCLFSLSLQSALYAQNLPIDVKSAEKFGPRPSKSGSPLSLDQIVEAIDAHPDGLQVKFPAEITTIDGRKIPANEVYGTVLVGPYPYAFPQSRFRHKRFSDDDFDIKDGKALIKLAAFFERDNTENAAGWTAKSQGRFAIRIELSQEQPGPDKPLGTYDTFATVRIVDGKFHMLPSILEGPDIHMVNSDHPDWVIVSVVTNSADPVVVRLNNGKEYTSAKPVLSQTNWNRHEIKIDGLEPSKSYAYHVRVGPTVTETITFRTAPPRGDGHVRFAFLGDSRGGVGNSMSEYMKVNYDAMERLTAIAQLHRTDLVLFGGDLSNGYTQYAADFETQLRAWRQSVSGISNSIPIYTLPGNHEALTIRPVSMGLALIAGPTPHTVLKQSLLKKWLIP